MNVGVVIVSTKNFRNSFLLQFPKKPIIDWRIRVDIGSSNMEKKTKTKKKIL